MLKRSLLGCCWLVCSCVLSASMFHYVLTAIYPGTLRAKKWVNEWTMMVTVRSCSSLHLSVLRAWIGLVTQPLSSIRNGGLGKRA